MRAQLPVIALVIVPLSLAGSVQVAVAQSLADVARKEQERRKAVGQPSKVITEKDLGRVPPVSPPPDSLFAPATDSLPVPEPGGEAQEAAATTDGAADQAPARDQAYWAGREQELQAQLDRDEAFAAALQSQINGLTTQFTNQDDPAQQARVGAERQKAIDQLNELTKQVEADRKALADLREEARRAGVPAGWLR